MLVACPECERRVSDRAVSCPDCGFPVAEELALERARAAEADEARSRRVDGEVDCPLCDARGFAMVPVGDEGATHFAWCSACEHSGRVPLVVSSRGYYAVAFSRAEAFVAGASVTDTSARFLGENPPPPFRYPKAGERRPPTGARGPATPTGATQPPHEVGKGSEMGEKGDVSDESA